MPTVFWYMAWLGKVVIKFRKKRLLSSSGDKIKTKQVINFILWVNFNSNVKVTSTCFGHFHDHLQCNKLEIKINLIYIYIYIYIARKT